MSPFLFRKSPHVDERGRMAVSTNACHAEITSLLSPSHLYRTSQWTRQPMVATTTDSFLSDNDKVSNDPPLILAPVMIRFLYSVCSTGAEMIPPIVRL